MDGLLNDRRKLSIRAFFQKMVFNKGEEKQKVVWRLINDNR